MDVKSTLLNGFIEEVFVKQPPGFENPEYLYHVFKLTKAYMSLNELLELDDIIFGSSNPSLCKEFSDLMQSEFKMSMMDELTFFLGLQIRQCDKGIFICQSKYTRELIHKFGLSDAKAMKTPMSPTCSIDKDDIGKAVDETKYRGMIGSLQYLTASRPDIMFSVC
ncbi:uncharacterized mitochondrial protein AtMg00810-like [Lycium barbarum]|uniref:uncharacterized mitochondrial protein AtMg00810-like n=1 Tax=Lycium barbarum TaxID=112863 RepID=UPI00293EE397|nr:uncharacterized mitochondrial protein AtMg00810-like [Lycium barbarum]